MARQDKIHQARPNDKWCLGDYIAVCGKRAEYVAHACGDITCKACLKKRANYKYYIPIQGDND